MANEDRELGKLNGLPWYPRHPRDLIEAMTGMPYDTRMQYGLLLDLIYIYSNRLPDDARFIAGVFGCSVRKWNAVRADLISRGKIEVNRGIISNKVADKIVKSSRKFHEKQVENGSQLKKNNSLDEAKSKPKPSQPQPQLQEQDLEGKEPSKSKQQQQHAGTIFERIFEACGLDPTDLPKHWKGSPAATHVVGWQVAYGLTDDEVIEAARISREAHDTPPDGPKALDRAMQAFATAKAAAGTAKPMAKPKPTAPVATPDETAAAIAFWAEKINGQGYVAASTIRPDQAREMLHLGLVTADRLRERGIAA